MSLNARRFAADVDRLLDRVTPFGFAGAILVAHRDDVLLQQSYGLADRANAAPNTPETVFCLGSISKQFTAVAVMALAQDGKLDPDDPVARYLDGVSVRFKRGTMGILSITQGGVNVGVAALEMAQGWALPCVPFGGKLLGYHLPLGRVVTVEVADRTG